MANCHASWKDGEGISQALMTYRGPPQMVERIRLSLTIRAPSATVRSTAIVLRAERPPPLTPQQSAAHNKACHALLSLVTRDADAHELAGQAAQMEHGSEVCDGVVHLGLANGSSLATRAHTLARHSPMFQTLVASGGSQWREGSGDGMWNVSLITHDSHAVRSLVTWMETPDGAAKRAAADAMLSAESVVAVARLAHYLEVQPMLSAAVHKIASALDAANAPSILLLARELHQTDLEEEATRFTIASLDAVEAEADYWSELPQATRETLKLLREATLRNPLLSAAGCSAAPISQTTMATSGKELLAMVRESLREVRDRYAEATKRQALEATSAEVAATDAADAAAGRRRRVTSVLDRQAERIRTVETYLVEQEREFAAILDTEIDTPSTPARAATPQPAVGTPLTAPRRRAGSGSLDVSDALVTDGEFRHDPAAFGRQQPFVPSYTWQALADDAALRVPPGLEIDLPLDGVGQRRARIPPCWQLRVWVPQPLLGAFWRADLKRETFVAEINARASRALGVEVRLQYTAAVRGGGAGSEPPPPLDDVATAEEVGLWERQGSLQLVPLSQP